MIKSIRIIFVMTAILAVNIWADADTVTVDGQPSSSTAIDTSAQSSSMPIDTSSQQSFADTAVSTTSQITTTPQPRRDINYTGASLSLFVPGAGQFYQGRYVLGSTFFAAEAITGGMTIYWFDEASWRKSEIGRLRDSAAAIGGRRDPLWGEEEYKYRDSIAGLYGVYADRQDYDAREARYMAYSMLAWTVGLHLFNVTNALETGGMMPTGAAKDPVKAGLLAAVPFLGLGQLYNGRPGKAGMMAMTQTSLAVMASTQHHLMTFANEKYDQMRDSTSAQYMYRADHLAYWKGRYDRAFSQRNTYLWVTLFSYIYGILDAVVDAHLSDYPERIKAGSDLSFGIFGAGDGVGVMMSLKY